MLKSALFPFAAAVAAVAFTPSARADGQALLPIPAQVREILDARCVMCHGEIIDGEAEIREDLEMTTDEKLAETLSDAQTMLEMIRDDEMPQEARLSFRLRRNAEMRARLDQIIEDYEANDEKAVLMAWLEAALGKSE